MAFWIFVFTGTVTSAAVLRSGVHIFLGWGAVREAEESPKHEEKPETQAGHSRTPKTMFLPAATLAVAGLLLGVLPRLQQSTLRAEGVLNSV